MKSPAGPVKTRFEFFHPRRCVRSNWELQHRQSQNKTELLEALSDEQKELLEKFCATEIELNGISEREAFTAGFKIAMRLAAEAFYTADNE